MREKGGGGVNENGDQKKRNRKEHESQKILIRIFFLKLGVEAAKDQLGSSTAVAAAAAEAPTLAASVFNCRREDLRVN